MLAGRGYSILASAEVKDKEGNPVKLVKLRNPYTSEFWEGDWNDTWKGWTKAAREKIDH